MEFSAHTTHSASLRQFAFASDRLARQKHAPAIRNLFVFWAAPSNKKEHKIFAPVDAAGYNSKTGSGKINANRPTAGRHLSSLYKRLGGFK